MFKNIEDSQITISELMLPSHSNFSGKIHGGYILDLMDQIAFACASKHSRHYCGTASVEKGNFLNPIEVGELVTMKASIIYVGRTSMVVGIRVEAENIRTGVIKHCNSSYFTMVAKDDDDNPKEVPGLILSKREDARRFAKVITRNEIIKRRKSEFTQKNFNLDEYIDILKKHNVKVELSNIL